MADHTVERVISLMETITSSFDKLKEFEAKGCSKTNLENELILIRDTAGEVPSLTAQIFKENPSLLQSLANFAPLFKFSFLNAISIMIPAIKMQSNPSVDWLKTQSSLAIAIMNENGTINTLRAFLTFLR